MRILLKKLKEIRVKYEKSRPIVVVGSNQGSKVAMMAAAHEPVDVVVALGIHLAGTSTNPE
jgi:pimeloyl-ACP methyl ester carboxylesterase